MTVFRWGASTHPGRVRQGNEDSVHAARGMFIVADGMGGHRAGEIASQLTVESVSGAEVHGVDDMIGAVRDANGVVHSQSLTDPDLAGMGTTVTALTFVGSPVRGVLANVGDSRAYRFRDDAIERLTEDHTYVAALLREGSISPAEASAHPYRNMLTRAIGVESQVDVDAWELEIHDGDRFLLCSDGLVDELTDDQLAATLRRLIEPEDAARELIRLANERGGRDNITVVVVDAQADGAVDSASVDRSAAVDPDPAPPTESLDGLLPPTGDPEPLDPTLADDPVAVAAREAAAAEAAADPLDGPTAGFAATSTAPDTDDPHATTPLLQDDWRTTGPDTDIDDGYVDPGTPLLTWRALIMTFAVIAVFVAAFGAVGFWARSGAHLGFSADEVVIYEGRPGSILWFSPTLVERTGIFRTDLPEAVAEDIDGGRQADSLDDARSLVDELRADLTTGTTTSSSGSDPNPDS